MTDQELAAEATELRKQFAEWSGLGIEAGHLATVVMGGLRNGVERRDDLRAQLEAVTRERDALLDERRLVALELGCGLQVPLPGRLADVAKHYASQVREGEARLTRERDELRLIADGRRMSIEAGEQVVREQFESARKARRERDEARESEARMRAALEERQKALEAALEERASALSERNWANERHDEALADVARMRAAAEFGQKVAEERGVLQGLVYWRQKAEEWRAALSAPAPEPSERMMRVAEAVREACVETADASDPVSRRVAEDLRAIDLRAIVAKVTP